MSKRRGLSERIEDRTAKIAVIGLGYVGLPLAAAFAKSGFPVVGIDVDEEKIAALRSGKSYVGDVCPEELHLLPAKKIEFTTDYGALRTCDGAIICVPTPLGKTRDPDMSFLIQASEAVSGHIHREMLISLESTTYPGTTEELVQPILERTGLQAGRDFFLAFSPERIDPGRKDHTLADTPKVVGGATPECLEMARQLYGAVIRQVVPVSSTRSAEMVKLLENTFRAVNIALVNEIAIMCDKLDLDVWEVVEAAGTKPYGFMKFSPGPGVGGHCIPLDPHYLSWKLKTLNYNARFIQLAGEINSQMPAYWANRVQNALNERGLPVKGSPILILGVAYKKDVNDVRESPALDIIELLRLKGAQVSYYDPHVPEIIHNGFRMIGEANLEKALKRSVCTLIVTDHSSFDWESIARKASLILDTRNVLAVQRKSESMLRQAAPR